MEKQALNVGDSVKVINSGHPYFGKNFVVTGFLGKNFVQCININGAGFTMRRNDLILSKPEKKKSLEENSGDTTKIKTPSTSKKSSTKGASDAKSHTSKKKESKASKKTKVKSEARKKTNKNAK